MGTAKWRLALWRYNLKIWARNREGERRSDLNDEHCLAGPGPAGLAGAEEEGRSVFFFTTLSFPAGVFPTFWELVFSRQLFSGVEKACRYVDRTGYQRNDEWFVLKDASDGDLEAFCTHAYCRCDWLGTGFPAGGFHSFCVGYFFRWRQGKVKRERIKIVGPQNVLSVLFSQEKNGLARTKWCRARKKKSYSKGVCVRVIAFLPMRNFFRSGSSVATRLLKWSYTMGKRSFILYSLSEWTVRCHWFPRKFWIQRSITLKTASHYLHRQLLINCIQESIHTTNCQREFLPWWRHERDIRHGSCQPFQFVLEPNKAILHFRRVSIRYSTYLPVPGKVELLRFG